MEGLTTVRTSDKSGNTARGRHVHQPGIAREHDRVATGPGRAERVQAGGAIGVIGPPSSATFTSLLACTNPSHRPSGEKKGRLAPSDPGIGYGSGRSIRRAVEPLTDGAFPTYTTCAPSGENAMVGSRRPHRLGVPRQLDVEAYLPGGGRSLESGGPTPRPLRQPLPGRQIPRELAPGLAPIVPRRPSAPRAALRCARRSLPSRRP